MPIQRPKTETTAAVEKPKWGTVVAKPIGDYAVKPRESDALKTSRLAAASFATAELQAEAEVEASLMDFIAYFLRLIPKPTQTQVVGLATSLGCDPKDMQVMFCTILGADADDEMKNALRDSDLKGDPGINKPGDLDSFDYEKINPYGRTSLDAIESPMSNLGLDLKESLRVPVAPVVPGPTYPAIQPNLIPQPPQYPTVPINPAMLAPGTVIPPLNTSAPAGTPTIARPPSVTFPAMQPNPVVLETSNNLLSSKSKVGSSFLLGMDDEQDNVSDSVVADRAPTNETTGIDDGAPVDTNKDDKEQQALIDYVDIEEPSDVEELNNNRYLVDDGLTKATNT